MKPKPTIRPASNRKRPAQAGMPPVPKGPKVPLPMASAVPRATAPVLAAKPRPVQNAKPGLLE